MSVRQTAPRRSPARAAARLTTSQAILALSALAWALLAALTVAGSTEPFPAQGHLHHATRALEPWSGGWTGMWLLMVAAMMWPLTVPTLTAVSRSAFPGWRFRLVTTCLATGTLLWLAVGLLGATAARAVGVPTDHLGWQLGWVAMAVVAMRSARRARLLWTCAQLPPLAPGGRRGLGSAVGAGVVAWRRCALLCGPVMTAMVIGHNPVLLVGASLAAWWEASHPRAWRDPVPALLLGAAAVGVVLTSALPEVIGRV